MGIKEKISNLWKRGEEKKKEKEKARKKQAEVSVVPDELNEEYLFDFTKSYGNSGGGLRGKKNESSGSNATFRVMPTSTHTVVPTDTDSGTHVYFVGNYESVNNPQADKKLEEKPQKIKAKPIDVLNEIETVPTPFSLVGLDQKIAILNDKRDFIQNKYARREVEGVIERLENRKQYANHVAFFAQFQNTTDQKIEALLDKYDLEMKPPDLFVPEFPDQAVSIMKQYTQTCKKICDRKPVFYVIAEPGDFKEKYEKRDPILLVQSPFGFYWQILGAWDKVMIMLGEL